MLTALTALRFRENGTRRTIRSGETFEVEDDALRADLLNIGAVREAGDAPSRRTAALAPAPSEAELERRNLLDRARALDIKGVRANTSTEKLREKIAAATPAPEAQDDEDDDDDEDML